MTNVYAPVLVSVYNRFDHFKNCITTLQKNEEAKFSDLFIVSDAPYRNDDITIIDDLREYTKTIYGFNRVTLLANEQNKGGDASVKDAINKLFETNDKIIYLEDDIIVGPYFLNYMNLLLEKYKPDKNIFSVSGYNYLIKIPRNYPFDVYFYSGFSAWGVGYWKEKYYEYYNQYRIQPENYICDKKLLLYQYKEHTYMGHRILMRDISGKATANDAKVCFYQFCNNMVSVFPVRSLVRNTGHDGSGVNCHLDFSFMNQKIDSIRREYKLPKTVVINKIIWKRLKRYFSNFSKKRNTLRRWFIDPARKYFNEKF